MSRFEAAHQWTTIILSLVRAVSRLPSKTDEARHGVYERARTVLQEKLRTLDPPISQAELAKAQFALEEAIRRVEQDVAIPPRSLIAASGAGLPNRWRWCALLEHR